MTALWILLAALLVLLLAGLGLLRAGLRPAAAAGYGGPCRAEAVKIRAAGG